MDKTLYVDLSVLDIISLIDDFIKENSTNCDKLEQYEIKSKNNTIVSLLYIRFSMITRVPLYLSVIIDDFDSYNRIHINVTSRDRYDLLSFDLIPEKKIFKNLLKTLEEHQVKSPYYDSETLSRKDENT